VEHSEHSPNGKHKVALIYEGEIRFGPPFFKLSLNGKVLNERNFGGDVSWSDNSVYLAAQEWLEMEYQKGPVTRAILIDVEKRTYAALRTVEKGFAEDFHFSGRVFVYKKHYYGSGVVEEVEVELANIHNWKALDAL
jgi:hypothetical protein